ncbi:hypothetical protein BKA81DRAFT_380770 [Phyllosticta paracitricarpa]
MLSGEKQQRLEPSISSTTRRRHARPAASFPPRSLSPMHSEDATKSAQETVCRVNVNVNVNSSDATILPARPPTCRSNNDKDDDLTQADKQASRRRSNALSSGQHKQRNGKLQRERKGDMEGNETRTNEREEDRKEEKKSIKHGQADSYNNKVARALFHQQKFFSAAQHTRVVQRGPSQ